MSKTDRIVTIISDYSFPISNSLEFNSKEKRDSEALHELLCFNDPGDNYTVKFENKKTTVPCNCENSLCSHTDMCPNKVEEGTNLIHFLGETCPACYESYPANFKNENYENKMESDYRMMMY